MAGIRNLKAVVLRKERLLFVAIRFRECGSAFLVVNVRDAHEKEQGEKESSELSFLIDWRVPGWDSVAKSNEGRELAELRCFLGGDAEQLADEFDLGDHISFARPSHPTLSDHVHRLNATQGPPRCPHRSITLR